MSELIEKLQQEKLVLGGNIARLSKFIYSGNFQSLDELNRSVLLIQESSMRKYYSVLNVRIGLLLGEDSAKEIAEKWTGGMYSFYQA